MTITIPVNTKHVYNICKTSAQRRTLYKCYTNVLGLLGYNDCTESEHIIQKNRYDIFYELCFYQVHFYTVLTELVYILYG